MFVVFDEMNLHDIENGTRTVEVSGNFVSAQKAKGGAHVIMGVPEECLHAIMNGDKQPLLILLDYKEYNKRKANK